MNSIIDKPHLIFLPAIPIILLIGFLSGDSILDFNIADTYYVIASNDISIFLAMLFAIMGLGYWIIKRVNGTLSVRLNWFHIGLTFGGTIIALILSQFYRENIMEFEFNNGLSLIISLVILITILGQIIFPINIIYGILNKKKPLNSIDNN